MKRIVFLILLFVSAPVIFACTGFVKIIEDDVYFAANEDWFNPYTKIWTIPEDEDNYGLLILGFSNMYPQTIINSQGLAMDGFATEALEVKDTQGKKSYNGILLLEVFKKCATVVEALEMLEEYNLGFLTEAQILLGDKTGDSALIEGDIIHRIAESYQVATNFYLSKTEYITCSRYNLSSHLLKDPDVTKEDLPEILNKTKQYNLTQYSYIFNLTEGTMELFFFGDFENPKVFDIDEVIRQGTMNVDMPRFFENEDYNWYLANYHGRKPQRSTESIEDLSKYTGYYNSRSMGTSFDIVDSNDTLKLILDEQEFVMIPAKDGSFFFDELDYVLWFHFEEKKKPSGIYIKHNYFHINEYARKIHPLLSWLYKL